MTWKHARRLRQGVQVACLLLFILLLFATVQQRLAPSLSDLFFRLNPLSALTAMLSEKAWIPRLGLALLTILLTIVLGRVWCGWLCPFGTLLEWARFRSAHKRAARLPVKLRTVKYFLLAVILVLALLGNLTLAFLDPLAIFTHSMTTTIIPVLNYSITSLERLLYAVPFLRPVVDWIE